MQRLHAAFAAKPASPPPEPRPSLWRRVTAPAHLEPRAVEAVDRYTSLPIMRPRRRVAVTRRLGAAVHEVEHAVERRAARGCMHLVWAAAVWWAWHRWRR